MIKSVLIQAVKATAYRVPTDFPESDGTFAWDHTTVVIVILQTHAQQGIGYTYGDAAVAELINNTFASILIGNNAVDIPLLWEKMVYEVRNSGWRGIAASAISAVDIALWDLKAKLLDVPLCVLFGMARSEFPVYGSGGFISYPPERLQEQLEGWKHQGIMQFKIKIGQDKQVDLERIAYARTIIGSDRALYVDANGAYTPQEALGMAHACEDFNITWFEEPVSSDDLEGLKFVRSNLPSGINVAAGEYGSEMFYFRHMLETSAVDVLQADATRCGGFTGFFQAATLSRAFNTPLSSHTAPSVHLHACLHLSHAYPMEYFHDHVRIEDMFFEGVPVLKEGRLWPQLDRPGLGLILKEKAIEPYRMN